METGALNLARADGLIAALYAAGLRHAVLAPGARSAPLALAALRRPELQCHVIGDERAAGFFALGIGKATGVPAAVIVTSGTAVANLWPAVMEADLAAVPLLLLTADRPPEAIGWGGNQTADQTKLFGARVRAAHAMPLPDANSDSACLVAFAARLIEECRSPLPGPVHANLPWREPLLPATLPPVPPLPCATVFSHPPATAPAECAALAAELAGQPGVILVGGASYPPDFAGAIAELAARFDAPVLADPLANLRWGPQDRTRLLAHQARFLRSEALPAPAWVLRFGAFPVSRMLERWLAGLHGTRQVLVAAPGQWPDPAWRSDVWLRGDACAIARALAAAAPPPGEVPAAFCAAWQAAEARVLARSPDPAALFEGTVAHLLLDALPAGAHCFVGNSLAIRAVDAFGGSGDKPLTLHGNRGASGIDGNLATAAGIAAATGSRIVALVGDQTLLHDAGSLALIARCGGGVVLLDNGGGGIFDHLPLAKTIPETLFARGWTAQPTSDFAALAAAFGLSCTEVTDPASLRLALAKCLAADNAWMLRVVIDRGVSQALFFS